MRLRRIAPWVAAVLTVAGVVGSAVLDARAGSHGEHTLTGVAWAAAALASSAVGLVLAARRSGNPIGWLLLANGLVLTVHQFATPYADYVVLADPDALPGGEWAVLFHERAWPTLFMCATAIALVFPDGRLPSPRWRPVALVAATSFVALTAVSLLAAGRYSDKFEHVSSPLPELSEAVVGLLFAVSGLGALASLVAAALGLRTRMRRASLVERLQLKWLAYAAALVPAAVVVSVIESSITGREGAATVIATALALTAIPVAIGIAVMRYRLYEIDRLINRTLVYVTLTVGLAATFAAVSLTLGMAIGSGSTLPTAAGTLAVALVFAPLRSRAQRLVDRRFDRARYEGLRRVERHLEDLPRRPRRSGGHGRGARRGDRRSDPRAVLLAARRGAPRRCVRSRRAPAARRGPGADAGSPWRASAGNGRARHDARRASRSAGERHRGRRVGDRDRPPARRGASPARRGRGVADPDRQRRLRGATPARARPPRRRPAATRFDRARTAPRAGAPPDSEP